MPKYRYTAINKLNKKLVGVVEAPNEEDAKIQLNSMGLSVLEVNLSNEEQEAQDARLVFQFEAYDKAGKKVVGTIKSNDEISALKKLTSEYELRVEEMSYTQNGITSKVDPEILKTNLDSEDVQNKTEDINYNNKNIENKVNEILNRVQSSLEQIKEKLTHEAKLKIKKQIDKLQLIKSSTNIDYIEESAKKLLNEIQNHENYIATEEVSEEKGRLALETQKLMLEIQKERSGTGINQDIGESIEKKLKSLSEIQLTENSGLFKKFLKELAEKLSKYFEESEKIKLIKVKLSLLNEQIWDYRKKWFFGKNTATEKEEINQALKTLQSEKLRLKTELAAAREDEQSKTTESKVKKPGFLLAANTFTGWLLFFYLLYYFLGFLLSSKNLGFNQSLSWNFNIFNVPLLKEFVLTSFILHTATSLKINFFRYNKISNIIIWLITPLVIIISILNL